MATSRVWIHSWLLPILTSIVLALIFFIFYCICWQRKKIPQSYALEKNNLRRKISINSLRNVALFRKFSITNKESENSIFTSRNLPIFSTKCQKPESDLMNSVEVIKSFDNVVLQLEENEPPLGVPREEMQSCTSTDSLNTFYSVHTNLRRSCSFVSVISDNSDLDTFLP